MIEMLMKAHLALSLTAANTASLPQAVTISFDALDLMKTCSVKTEGNQQACYFYIMGVAQGASVEAALAKDGAHNCVPPGTSMGNLVALVKHNLSTNLSKYSEDKHMPAALFVATVIDSAYACKK